MYLSLYPFYTGRTQTRFFHVLHVVRFFSLGRICAIGKSMVKQLFIIDWWATFCCACLKKNWISIGPYKIPSSTHMAASRWLTSLLLVALLILTRYRGDSCGFVIIVSFKPLVIGANTCNMDWNALNAYWYFSLYLKWFPIDHLEWVTDAVLFLPLMLLFFHISSLMWKSRQVPI